MYDTTGINVVDRREMLRVKVKSLAEEARIIRQEEHRTKGVLRDELHRHRTWDVRREARASCLAYGFIRGRSYSQMEARCVQPPNWETVKRLVQKFGPAQFTWPESLLAELPEPARNLLLARKTA